MELITGYKGTAHISPAQDAAWHNALYDGNDCILEYGTNFEATIVDNNTITIGSGLLLFQGRYCIQTASKTLTIDSGTAGYKRYDLIVARYTRNATTKTEACDLVVIKGTPTTGTPTLPSTYEGKDIDSDNIVDKVLYEVYINGITISSVSKPTDLANAQGGLHISPDTITAYQNLGWQIPTGGAVINSLLQWIAQQDFVIDSGTSERTGITWKWEKWASGKITCCGAYRYTSTVSASKQTRIVALPFNFPSTNYTVVATPTANASIISTSAWWGVCDSGANGGKNVSGFMITYTTTSAYNPMFDLSVTYLP